MQLMTRTELLMQLSKTQSCKYSSCSTNNNGGMLRQNRQRPGLTRVSPESFGDAEGASHGIGGASHDGTASPSRLHLQNPSPRFPPPLSTLSPSKPCHSEFLNTNSTLRVIDWSVKDSQHNIYFPAILDLEYFRSFESTRHTNRSAGMLCTGDPY